MKEQFIETTFRAQSLELLAACEQVIETYQAQGLKLTLRQLYYQLVVTNTIPNRGRAYKNLGNLVSRGRLAGELDWDAIEDRIRVPDTPSQWTSPKHAMDSVLHWYRLDRWLGQTEHVEVWVEKDALAGVLSPITEDRHVTLMVNRGYSSQSAMYDAAQRIHDVNEQGRSFTILYLGDLDPSGEDMVRDIDDRLNKVFYATCEVRKIAITPEQVREFRPPPNPAKMSDSRAQTFVAQHGYDSYEVDALPPDALHRIVNEAIDEYADPDKLRAMLSREAADKVLMREAAANIMRERRS